MEDGRYMFGVVITDDDVLSEDKIEKKISMAITGYFRHVVSKKTPNPKDGILGFMMSNELMSKLHIEGDIYKEYPVIGKKNITKNSLYFGRIR